MKDSERRVNETSVLYEISLSIGASLELKNMLSQVLSKMLRGLNCSAALVYSYQNKSETEIEWNANITLPRNALRRKSIEEAMQAIELPTNINLVESFLNDLPTFIKAQQKSQVYLFALPKFGFLVLDKTGPELSFNLHASFERMMPKLAHSCLACLHEENLRMKMNEAEAANVAKSQFLARMSHEIRTPMNGVLGLLDLVLDTSLNSEQRENLKLANQSANNLLNIINDILDLSRIESGKVDVFRERVDLYSLVAQCLKALAPRAWTKALEIRYELTQKVPRFVKTDASRMRQILTNLVGNAIKFTEQGEIVLRLDAKFSHDSYCDLVLEVEDTGIGIEQEKTINIFNPFEQIDDGVNRKYEGTGLGLTITEEIVSIMGGSISVKSEVNKGSRFTIQLPHTEVLKSDNGLSTDADEMRAQICILSNKSVQAETLASLVSGLGHLVCVLNGREQLVQAIEINKQKQLNTIVVCDYEHLPESISVNELAKISNDTESFHLINLHSNASIKQLSIEHAACKDKWLSKPLDIIDLGQAIDSLGNGQGAIEKRKYDSLESLNGENGEHQNVLVVDDNPINLKIIVKILGRMGFNVQVALNGSECLEKLEQHRFNIVFMDVMMPVMDGIEATKEIRKRESDRQLDHQVIIAMTANAMRGDREKCIAAGMDGYVAKPINLEALKKELCDVKNSLDQFSSEASDVNNQESVEPAQDNPENANRLEINWQRALQLLGGDEELLDSIVEMYIEDIPNYIEAVREAIDLNTPDLMLSIAHTVKSMGATLACKELRELAYEVEQDAKNQVIKDEAVTNLLKHISNFNDLLSMRVK